MKKVLIADGVALSVHDRAALTSHIGEFEFDSAISLTTADEVLGVCEATGTPEEVIIVLPPKPPVSDALKKGYRFIFATPRGWVQLASFEVQTKTIS